MLYKLISHFNLYNTMSQVNVYKEKNEEILGYISELNRIEDELTAKLEFQFTI